MPGQPKCRECGTSIPPEAKRGFCPRCLFGLGLAVGAPAPFANGETSAAPGTTVRYFGDYELLEEIGRGGMGVVWRARQVSLDRPVALKLILTGELASEVEIERFRREAQAAANLDHPNIVAIYEVGEQEGQQYFAMQLVEGQSLAAESPKSEVRSPKSIAELVAKVARAVHHAHQHGILHRDLKPANILLDARGEPHVTDFGLAKRVDSALELTCLEAILGSPHYMSPEQAQGCKDLTTATDNYSLGMVLYFLLTGLPAFQADTPLAVLKKVVEEEPVPPSRLAVRPDGQAGSGRRSRQTASLVDPDLETICLKCLEKDRERRYHSAEALAEDLERWLRHEPILARPTTQVERLRKWVHRRPAVAGLVTATALLVLVLGIGAAVWALSSRENAREAREQLARTYLRQGQQLCAAGAAHDGLLWFARSLRECPTRNEELARVIRLNIASWSGQTPALKWVFEHETGESNRWAFASVPLVHVRPDGQELVSAGRLDHTVRIWSFHTGTAVGRPMRHKTNIFEAFYAAHGERIVTVAADGLVRFWSAVGDPLGDPVMLSSPVLATTSLPAHGLLAVWSKKDSCRVLRLSPSFIDLGTWTHPAAAVRTQAEGTFHYAIAQFSPDGKRLVVSCTDGSAHILSFGTNVSAKVLNLQEKEIWALALSPDGQLLGTRSENDLVRAWSLKTGEAIGAPIRVVGDFPGNEPNDSLFFSPDGRTLAVKMHASVQLWDVANRAPLTGLLEHAGGIVSVCFSPDSRYLVTFCMDAQVRIWSVPSGEPVLKGIPYAALTGEVGFAPDGRQLIVSSSGAIEVWDFHTQEDRVRRVRSKSGQVWSVDFHPDSERFLVGGHPNEIEIWSARSLQLEFESNGPTNYLWDAKYSPDGKRIVSAEELLLGVLSEPGAVSRIWSGKGESQRILEYGSVSNRVNRCCSFGPRGDVVATGSWNGQAKVFAADTGALLACLEHPGFVEDLAFHPNGEWLLTACNKGQARLWAWATTNLVYPPIPHGSQTVAFSRDGTRFATGSGDGSIRFWDTRSGQPLGPTLLHKGGLTRIAFRSDGQWLVSGGNDRAVRLWSLATGEELGPALKLPAAVRTVTIHPADDLVVAGGECPEVALWGMPSLTSKWLQDFQTEVEVLTGSRLSEHGTLVRLNYAEWEKLRQSQSGR